MTNRKLRDATDMAGLGYDDRGLLPVIAQDATTGSVLMVAWANLEALRASAETGELHFWSRSRGALWKKGETSGNVLRLRSLYADCDLDTVLALVDPTGPACHTGETTCFGDVEESGNALAELWDAIEERSRTRPEGSYTARLLRDENLRFKKLGEETTELVAALARGQEERVSQEAADLLYHLLVTLHGAGVGLDDVMAVLSARRRRQGPNAEAPGDQ